MKSKERSSVDEDEKISLVAVLILAGFMSNDVVVHADDHEHEDKNMKSIKNIRTTKTTMMMTMRNITMMMMKVKLIIFKTQ